MNKKAKEIGMHNTVFKNSHGLDEVTKNYSTAYDMALLSSYAYKIPFYREVSGTKYHDTKTLNKAYSWINRNNLLFLYKNCTGGKTGYTPSAGKTLVSTATKNNLNLTIVTLNDANHYENHQVLYEKYFEKYKNYILIDKNLFNNNSQYAKENLYIMDDVYYPIKENEKDNLTYDINLESKYIEVLLKDKIVLKKKIYSKKIDNKKEKNIWQKIKNIFKIFD